MRIGFNANPHSMNKPVFKEWMKRLKPTDIVMFGDIAFAVEMYDALEGETEVTYREWPFEGGEIYKQTPAQVIERWRSQGHPELRRYAPNEPAAQDSRTLEWNVELMGRAYEAGLRVDVGQFAVGSYEAHDVESGKYDRLLRALHTLQVHRLGLHEYAAGSIPTALNSPDKLSEWDTYRPEEWPCCMPSERWGTWYPPYWTIRRSAWLEIRARELGLNLPQITFSEFGMDFLPHLDRPPYYIRQLQDKFGGVPAEFKNNQNPDGKLIGAETYRDVWATLWPEWSWEKAYVEQLKWADKIYPDNVTGLCLFMYEEGGAWQQKGFDVSNPTLLEELWAYSYEEEPEPEPEPPPPVVVPPPPIPEPVPELSIWEQLLGLLRLMIEYIKRMI